MDFNKVREFIGEMLYLGYDYMEAIGFDETDVTADALQASNEFKELCESNMSPYKAFVKVFFKC